MLAVAAGLAIALLWSVYGLRFHAGADGSDAFNRPMADKIDELTLPHWRAALHFADDRKLLPRAYLWGDRKSKRLTSSQQGATRMPSSALNKKRNTLIDTCK